MHDICKAHIATSGLMKCTLHRTGKFSISPTREKKKSTSLFFLSAYILFIYIIFIHIYCKELFNRPHRIKTDLDFRFYRKLKSNMLEKNFHFQIHVQITKQLTIND